MNRENSMLFLGEHARKGSVKVFEIICRQSTSDVL